AALQAARSAVASGGGVATSLMAAGDAWAAKAGGTSGVLWGRALRAAGETLSDQADRFVDADVTTAVRAGAAEMQTLGKAALGDKTMLDALLPFADELERAVSSGTTIEQAWSLAADVATSSAEETSRLRPMVGRARPLAERSVGTP